MTVLWTVLGVALIGVALRDIFHTLFAPTGTGSISSLAARHIWRLFRRLAQRRPQMLALAGPLGLLLIIALWTVALTVGWALVLWPHMSEAFLLSSGMEPGENQGFLDAIYLSLVTLATLGDGDITPQTDWLRLVAPLESRSSRPGSAPRATSSFRSTSSPRARRYWPRSYSCPIWSRRSSISSPRWLGCSRMRCW